MEDLQCIYDKRKSFYGKAKVEKNIYIYKNTHEEDYRLFSYGTFKRKCFN